MMQEEKISDGADVCSYRQPGLNRSGHYSTVLMVFLVRSSQQRATLVMDIELVALIRAADETEEELAARERHYTARGHRHEVLKVHRNQSRPDQSMFTASRAAQLW